MSAANSPGSSPAGAFAAPEDRKGTDIWYVGLSVDSRAVARHEHTLSEDERKRAGEFRFQHDATRYVVAHGALREILARYVRREARDLAFSATPSGKPVLVSSGAGTGIWFNLAHSADIALLAVSREGEVGIDVERLNPDLDLPAIARRCFSPGELKRLAADPPSLYVENFFTFWTRKEAYVKARGEGLSAPLTEIDVSASPALPGGDWVVRDIPVPPDYKGAIATCGGTGSRRSFRYDDLTS